DRHGLSGKGSGASGFEDARAWFCTAYASTHREARRLGHLGVVWQDSWAYCRKRDISRAYKDRRKILRKLPRKQQSLRDYAVPIGRQMDDHGARLRQRTPTVRGGHASDIRRRGGCTVKQDGLKNRLGFGLFSFSLALVSMLPNG